MPVIVAAVIATVWPAVMLAEAAGCRLELDLDAIEPPAGVALEAWLTCFPSYGYLLSVERGTEDLVAERVSPRGRSA